MVDQKHPGIESLDEVLARARRAVAIFGTDRLLPFADNPIASAEAARQKLAILARVAEVLRG